MPRRRAPREPARSLPTGGRRWLIRGLLVLFAFALVAVLELGLRIAGVAAPEPLVFRVRQGPLDVYQVNPRVGRRYFPPELARIMPEPGFQIFSAAKRPGTFRVFVLGESTTAGFPYHTHGSISAFLQSRLERRLPGREVEVVNCGLTALNSYAVRDFVRELVPHEPDLFVVYAGHNEFYGALGPASAIAFGKSRAVASFLRWTLDLRISRLLGQALHAARPAEPVRGKTLMGAMVGRTEIRPGDPTYRAALDAYEANLEDVVDAAGGVPVVLCEVVSNLRDQPPFEAVSRPDLTAEEAAELADARARLAACFAGGDWAAARRVGREAVAIDSTDAAIRYELARAYEAAGDRLVAAREYRAARDCDGIPFRAPSEVNRIVRRVAARGAICVPLEALFDSLAVGAAPGLDLFLEHVHPRLAATDEMARAILRALSGRVALETSVAGADTSSWLALAARQGITELDDEIAERRIFHLVHRWPYPADPSARFASEREPVVQMLAEDVLADRLDLVQAHVTLAERRLAENDRAGAYRELKSACRIFPVVPARFAAAGRLALELGQPEEALSLFERAAALDPANAEYGKGAQEARARAASRGTTVNPPGTGS